MTSFQRVQQWATFARIWHLYDAKWQNPFESAKIINKHLMGIHKPIYHPANDCGDHVVVINCKHIALPGDEWIKRVYFHHTGYPGGASWTLAWDMHRRDPTLVMKKACYNQLMKTLQRRILMCRLHLYDEEDVPKEIMANVSNQLRPHKFVPKKITAYSKKEIEEFPKIFDYPKDHVIK